MTRLITVQRIVNRIDDSDKDITGSRTVEDVEHNLLNPDHISHAEPIGLEDKTIVVMSNGQWIIIKGSLADLRDRITEGYQ